ncbi:hypothetical protein BDN70DRAFT_998898 [Pholiota conissans]|uniref:3'-5' exonuclease n=1 Tax=Pholiota conissans TaxID=109636 RepID=A0A9P6CQV5_9AGAR|nr:hypothetical protein BDN70DRAFT_998898 [Pholiota conissans]
MTEHQDDPEESSSNPPPPRKPGRPKGSKDGPRAPGAPKRGRPRTDRGLDSEDLESTPDIVQTSNPEGPAVELDEFGFEDLPQEALLELYEIEQAFMRNKFMSGPLEKVVTLEELEDASEASQRRPFFNHQAALSLDDEGVNDDDDPNEPENSGEYMEEIIKPEVEKRSANQDSKDPWRFPKPKHMPHWLYQFFIETVGPLIFAKDGNIGNRLGRPPFFSDRPAIGSFGSLWMHPPDPIMSLHQYRFEPELLYRPRIFFWLPHFFVDVMNCPNCRSGVLEKNGACPPRRIVDIEDVFWIVTWKYYCRKGCQTHFRGWNPLIINSLPPYIRHAFPAVLSRKGGLSLAVISLLRSSNQHKMGPSGVRSTLLEMHTHKYNIRYAQYLKAVFELIRGRQEVTNSQSSQSTLHQFLGLDVPIFGDFSDPEKYAGFVSSEFYLAEMMNQAIERDEADANQHTSCLNPDQIAIDDSHKVNKHIAKVDGVAIFNALWTCMDSRYIRAQVLTLTKSHEERHGPLKGISDSLKRYGYPAPQIAFSDDPLKDKGMLCEHFPSLAENLTPMSAAHGLASLSLPDSLSITFLGSAALVESTLSTILAPLEESSAPQICVSIDAEWNLSRTEGVSILQIAPHSNPNVIFIIPVYRFKDHLPVSLLRLFISKKVFKIGRGIRGDVTRLQKQFPQLVGHAQTNLIDLKEFCIARGIITRKEHGSLDALCAKVLGVYLEKPDSLRKHDQWEGGGDLSPALLNYAALDVYSSRLIFDKASERSPIKRPSINSPPGAPVTLLLCENGDPIAHGRIAQVQPATLGSVRVKTPTNSRMVIDIDVILNPSAAILLHTSPSERNRNRRNLSTKSGSLTLGELRNLAPGGTVPFQVVTPISSLEFYQTNPPTPQSVEVPSNSSIVSLLNQQRSVPGPCSINNPHQLQGLDDDDAAAEEPHIDLERQQLLTEEEEVVTLNMLEASSSLLSDTQKGKQRAHGPVNPTLSPASQEFIQKLKELVNLPPDANSQYTRIKKDLFHAMHMIPTPVNHGLRAPFFRALRDHIMRWDPTIRQTVDETCRRLFNLTFDQMLARNPRFIMECTPRYVPSPGVLVPAMSLVFDTFGNARDAKTGAPLFNDVAWQKAHAVLNLAREGYLSDNADIVLYEKAGLNKYGLQKWKCLRGTNNVEGGPHGDIYRKFGALHAGPRLTVNCLTDHRTWYNLQAYAMHLFGVDWEYHHDLALINRTSFLLNYLADITSGAKSYVDWTNGDLYEQTTEQFGICKFPDSLRQQLAMDPFDESLSTSCPLNSADDWLRRRQCLALPVIPPTTPEARQFFFSEITKYATAASNEGKRQINYIAFAQDWNRSADGKYRFYITPEVLSAYAKTWEKNSNIKASQELIADALDVISQTSQVFSAPNLPFPSFLTSLPSSDQPRAGVLELNDTNADASVPPSISTSLAISRPSIFATSTIPKTNTFPHSQSLIPDFLSRQNSPGSSMLDTLPKNVGDQEQPMSTT